MHSKHRTARHSPAMHWTGRFAALALVLAPSLALGGAASAWPAGDSAAAIKQELDDAVRAQALGVDKCLSWIERLYKLADADAGGEEGFQALELVLEIQDRRQSTEVARAAEGVLERILAYADDAAKIGPVIENLGDVEFARQVLERTKSPAVEATCLYAQVTAVIDSGYAAAIPADEASRALALAKRLQGELGLHKNSAGTPFKEVVAGDVFQLEHLNIGMQAPEIEGEDLDGARFKLSDYRGKVVVLDFWGNW